MKAAALFLAGMLATAPAFAMGNAPAREPQKKAAPVEPDGFKVGVTEAYNAAFKLSEEVAIRQEAVGRTFGDFLEATGTVIGDVDYVYTHRRQDIAEGGGASDSEGGTSGFFNARERDEGKFAVRQPLFQGFKEFGGLAGAGSLKSQRISERKQAENLLFQDVVSSYYGVLRYEKDLATIDGIRKLYDERMTELGEREEIGRSRTSEVATARSRMQTLEAERALSRGNFAIAKAEFEYLTGISPDKNTLKDEDVPDGVALPEDLLKAADERPDVKALKSNMDTYHSGIIVAQSGLLPRVDLGVDFYSHREGPQKDVDWDALLTVDAPLFAGGTNAAALKKANSDWMMAKLAYQRGRREAALDIQAAYVNLITARERAAALEEAVKSAEENFNFQKEEYGRNLVSNLDVLEALQTLLESRRDANEVHYEMKTNYWRYQTALGRGPAQQES